MAFDYSDANELSKREEFRKTLATRLYWQIDYNKHASINENKHLYNINAYIYVNTSTEDGSDGSSIKLNGQTLRQFKDYIESFTNNWTLKDLERLFTVDELPESFNEKLNIREESMRLNFPTDVTFKEEQLIYTFSLEVSENTVYRLFGKTKKVKESDSDRLSRENEELRTMVKQLLEINNVKNTDV